MEYLKKFRSSGIGQGLPDEKILKLVELSVNREWQKEIIIKDFDSVNQGLTELVEFCERLETAERNFQTQGEVQHLKNPISPVNATNPPSLCRAKGLTGHKTLGRGC